MTSAPSDPPDGVGRLAAFRSRSFAVFWSALAISAIGSRATLTANLWQLLQLTDSASLVGAVGLADAAALLLSEDGSMEKVVTRWNAAGIRTAAGRELGARLSDRHDATPLPGRLHRA